MNNLFFFTGENTPALEEKLRFWQQSFIEKYDATNCEVYDQLDQSNMGTLINSLETQPFLAEKRMVIVKDFPFSGAVKKKVETDFLEEQLADLPESTLAIFVSAKPDKRGKFYKWISKHATVESFALPKGRELQSWVQSRVQQGGAQIDAQAAQMLILYCGEDIVRIDGEIQKLLLLDRPQLSRADIQHFVSPTPEGKIFQCLDLMGKVSRVEILRAFEQLFQTGEDSMMVFFMLVRQMRLLLQIRSLLDEGMPSSMIQKKMKLAPFQVGLLVKQAEAFSFSQLKRAHRQLAEMDLKIKTGRLPSSGQGTALLNLSIDHFLCTLYE